MRSTIDGQWRPPPSYGRYGPTSPATKHATINSHHMRRVYMVRTRKKIFIASNITNNARPVDVDERRRRCSNATMGAVQPTGRYRQIRRRCIAPDVGVVEGGQRREGQDAGGRGKVVTTHGGDRDHAVVATQRLFFVARFYVSEKVWPPYDIMMVPY